MSARPGFQITRLTLAQLQSLFLKLDQTTPQTVVDGNPVFDAGLNSNGDVTLKAGEKLYLDGA